MTDGPALPLSAHPTAQPCPTGHFTLRRIHTEGQ